MLDPYKAFNKTLLEFSVTLKGGHSVCSHHRVKSVDRQVARLAQFRTTPYTLEEGPCVYLLG